jgi:hypothetical protein
MLLVDARPPVHWSPDEVGQAVEKQQKRAGALVALVKARLEADYAVVRAELNRLAGGQASGRVAVLARNAMLAQEAVELQTLAAEVAAGEESKNADTSLRHMSGLSVFASQALDKAYDAAREEGKRANPVADLRRTIGLSPSDPGADDHDTGAMGHGGPSANVVDGAEDSAVALSPLRHPGEGVSGPPPPEFPAPSEKDQP